MRPPIAACLRESLLPQSPNRPAGGPAAKYQAGSYPSGALLAPGLSRRMQFLQFSTEGLVWLFDVLASCLVGFLRLISKLGTNGLQWGSNCGKALMNST